MTATTVGGSASIITDRKSSVPQGSFAAPDPARLAKARADQLASALPEGPTKVNVARLIIHLICAAPNQNMRLRTPVVLAESSQLGCTLTWSPRIMVKIHGPSLCFYFHEMCTGTPDSAIVGTPEVELHLGMANNLTDNQLQFIMLKWVTPRLSQIYATI